jgi:hypothetical protein
MKALSRHRGAGGMESKSIKENLAKEIELANCI